MVDIVSSAAALLWHSPNVWCHEAVSKKILDEDQIEQGVEGCSLVHKAQLLLLAIQNSVCSQK